MPLGALVTKRCFKCLRDLPRSEFYAHAQMGDGLLGKCKECTKTDVRARYFQDHDRMLVNERERNLQPMRNMRLIWGTMVRRCHDPENRSYPMYGARGIHVCERWRDSFDAFVQDMGMRPSRQHSLDRIDNNGHYDPKNVRWATATEQARNRRSNRLLTYGDETLCVAEWAERTGLEMRVIYGRLHRGWDAHRALTTPVHATNKERQ